MIAYHKYRTMYSVSEQLLYALLVHDYGLQSEYMPY
jgi:hypothetical protein